MTTNRNISISTLVLVSIVTIVTLVCALTAGYGHDEVEHMHVAYRMFTGSLPYRDFPQNHSPGMWFVLKPIVSLLPYSIDSLLLARVLNVSFIPIVFFCSRSFLKRCDVSLSFTTDLVLSILLLAFLLYSQWIMIRPDIFAGTLVGLALLLLCSEQLTLLRVFYVGFFLGLALIFTPKIWPVSLLAVIVLVLRCFSRDDKRSVRSLLHLFFFLVGSLFALAPVVLWLVNNNLLDYAYQNVILLNSVLSMDLHQRARGFESPLLFFGLGGAVMLMTTFWSAKRHGYTSAMTIAAVSVLSFVNLQLCNHGDSYNHAVFIVPLLVSAAALCCSLIDQAQTLALKGIVVVCMPIMCLLTEVSFDININKFRSTEVPRRQMEELIGLGGVGVTCTAFAPFHPIFCEDVSPSMLGWDLQFYTLLRRTRFELIYKQLLRSVFDSTMRLKPDLIMISSDVNPWTKLKTEGIITTEELEAFWQLRDGNYQEISVGYSKIGVSKTRTKTVSDQQPASLEN